MNAKQRKEEFLAKPREAEELAERTKGQDQKETGRGSRGKIVIWPTDRVSNCGACRRLQTSA